MGYSPLDGLTMGTRGGGMDPAVVMDLCARHGVEAAARILNRESGLLALGGRSDMRALHAAGTAEAAFAVEHFCYWAIRHAGSMIAAMGGWRPLFSQAGSERMMRKCAVAFLTGWTGSRRENLFMCLSQTRNARSRWRRFG